MYDALPDVELEVVLGTSSFLMQGQAHLVNKIVLDFITLDPVPTVVAIRRAQPPEAAAGIEYPQPSLVTCIHELSCPARFHT